MSDTEPGEGSGVQVEPGPDAAAAGQASAHSAVKKPRTYWWESGEGEFSREVTAGVFADSRMILPGGVLSGLGLSVDCQFTLVDPRTGRKWAAAVTKDSKGASIRSAGLRDALQELGLQVGGTLVMRRHKAAAQHQPCDAHMIEVAAGVPRPAGGGSPSAYPPQHILRPIPKISGAKAEAAKLAATASLAAQPELSHWVEVEGSGEFIRQYLRTKHDKLQMPEWMAERLGIGSGNVTLTYQQRQWTMQPYRFRDKQKPYLCLQGGWKKFAEEVGLQQGNIITLSKDPAAAPQPAVAFARWHPNNAGGEAAQGEQAAEQRQRRQGQQGDESGEVRGAAAQARPKTNPLESSRLLTRLSQAGRQLWDRSAAGGEAKRSRLDVESTGREGTAAPATAASAATAVPATPAAAATAQPALPAAQVPQAAGASAAAVAAGPPLEPLDTYRAIKPAVMGCGVPAPTASSFLRLFLNRMDRSTQQAHYQHVLELQSGGVGLAGELREWVEGTVADMDGGR